MRLARQGGRLNKVSLLFLFFVFFFPSFSPRFALRGGEVTPTGERAQVSSDAKPWIIPEITEWEWVKEEEGKGERKADIPDLSRAEVGQAQVLI